MKNLVEKYLQTDLMKNRFGHFGFHFRTDWKNPVTHTRTRELTLINQIPSFIQVSLMVPAWRCLVLLAVVMQTGCADREAINSMQGDLREEKLKVEAYKKDAIKARDNLYAANQEALQAEQSVTEYQAKIDLLKSQIEELKGIKVLENIGAAIGRDKEGRVVSVNMISKPFTNDQIDVLKNFPSIKEVLMDGPSINLETFDILKELPLLEKLELSVSATNAECLKKLEDLQNLTFLQLKRTSVTDDSMAVLAKFPKLQQIRVGQTKIGDEGLQHLKSLKTLTALDLTDCNRVSDAGLAYLVALPKLKMLKVWGQGVTNEGLKSIGQMKSLEVLGMNDTRIDDEGMQAINTLEKLKEVSFGRTAISDFGIMQLTGSTGMKKMVLRDTNITDEALKFIGQLKNIEVLDLSECSSPGPTDIGIEELVGLPKLKDLNLWSTKVGDGAVEAIVKIPNLVRLNLDATKISDASMAFLPSLENLTWLHIGSTKITEKQISELYKLSKLKYLNLSFTEASFSDAVDEIYEKLKEATSEGCEIVGL
ncbi:MAG: hypothetical protein P8M80_01675 [Pirellulaceae bacterium]|nr:hypothetical protein [Pirellulaceae bacterium]